MHAAGAVGGDLWVSSQIAARLYRISNLSTTPVTTWTIGSTRAGFRPGAGQSAGFGQLAQIKFISRGFLIGSHFSAGSESCLWQASTDFPYVVDQYFFNCSTTGTTDGTNATATATEIRGISVAGDGSFVYALQVNGVVRKIIAGLVTTLAPTMSPQNNFHGILHHPYFVNVTFAARWNGQLFVHGNGPPAVYGTKEDGTHEGQLYNTTATAQPAALWFNWTSGEIIVGSRQPGRIVSLCCIYDQSGFKEFQPLHSLGKMRGAQVGLPTPAAASTSHYIAWQITKSRANPGKYFFGSQNSSGTVSAVLSSNRIPISALVTVQHYGSPGVGESTAGAVSPDGYALYYSGRGTGYLSEVSIDLDPYTTSRQVVGSGTSCLSFLAGNGSSACFDGFVVMSFFTGNLLIGTDVRNDAILGVDLSGGELSRFMCAGYSILPVDGHRLTVALCNQPVSLTVLPSGTVFFIQSNTVVRKLVGENVVTVPMPNTVLLKPHVTAIQFHPLYHQAVSFEVLNRRHIAQWDSAELLITSKFKNFSRSLCGDTGGCISPQAPADSLDAFNNTQLRDVFIDHSSGELIVSGSSGITRVCCLWVTTQKPRYIPHVKYTQLKVSAPVPVGSAEIRPIGVYSSRLHGLVVLSLDFKLQLLSVNDDLPKFTNLSNTPFSSLTENIALDLTEEVVFLVGPGVVNAFNYTSGSASIVAGTATGGA